MRNLLKKIFKILDERIYKKNNFVIISNNCWGAKLYNRLDLPYNTPFVGLFIMGPDYLKLLTDLDFYLNKSLFFVKKSRWISDPVNYPIGLLDDIEIHFMHYKDKNEAKSKWERRVARMLEVKDKDRYYFKICDRDLSNDDIITKFHNLPYKNKISFGLNDLDIKNHVVMKETDNNKTVLDGVKLYKNSFKYIDILKWTNTGVRSQNLYSKIKFILKVV